MMALKSPLYEPEMTRGYRGRAPSEVGDTSPGPVWGLCTSPTDVPAQMLFRSSQDKVGGRHEKEEVGLHKEVGRK